MGRSSTSGLLLLLVGSLGLIGFLTGQLDRWLAFLFTPPGGTPSTIAGVVGGAASPPGAPAATGLPPPAGYPAVANQRTG